MRNYLLKGKKVHLLEVYDGGAMFIGGYVLQIILQFVLSMVLVSTKVSEDFLQTMAGICLLSAINEIALVLTPLAYAKIKSSNIFKGVGYSVKISPLQGVILIFVAIFTVLAFSPIANGFVWLVEKTGYDVDAMSFLKITTPTSLVLGIIFMCILPAVCEELMYRGFIARSLADKNFIFGIFISGLLFAIMHGNPVQLVHQFFLGCVCAFVYYMSRSIWAPMIIHFVNNLVAIVGNYIMFKQGVTESVPPVWLLCVISIVGIIGLGLLLWAMWHISMSRKKKANARSASIDGMTNVDCPQGFEGKMSYLFDTRAETIVKIEENLTEDEQLEACDSEEMREVLLSSRREEKNRYAKKNKLSLIYAFVIAMAVWLLNTIMNYLR